MVPNHKDNSDSTSDSKNVNIMVLQYLKMGRTVVRLKNGDPFIFGRGGEEYLLFRAKGFEVEIVPGISSAFSAPLSGNIPVTQRNVADQVLIISGRGERGLLPVIPEFYRKRTTIVLMPVGRMHNLVLVRNFSLFFVSQHFSLPYSSKRNSWTRVTRPIHQ